MPDWLRTFFDWLHHLSQGQATFLGSFTGAVVGLIAILAGVVFNAHLNRRRDARLRRDEALALATALKAELCGVVRTFDKNAENVMKELGQNEGFTVPDYSQAVRVLPHLLPKIGMLDTATIQAQCTACASSPTGRTEPSLRLSAA